MMWSVMPSGAAGNSASTARTRKRIVICIAIMSSCRSLWSDFFFVYCHYSIIREKNYVFQTVLYISVTWQWNVKQKCLFGCQIWPKYLQTLPHINLGHHTFQKRNLVINSVLPLLLNICLQSFQRPFVFQMVNSATMCPRYETTHVTDLEHPLTPTMVLHVIDYKLTRDTFQIQCLI